MELVSVIIPMYNAENSIADALLSVRAQSAGIFEIFVVDDGSTDRSAEVVVKFQQNFPEMDIRLILQDNRGVSSARNVGMKAANGAYIALLDADDEWLPEKTALQMEVFSKNREVDFLTTLWNSEKITFPYKISENGLVKITTKRLLTKITGQTSTAIFKKKVLENTGFFDESMRYSEDANFWLRASLKNNMYLLPRSLVIAGKGKKPFGVRGLSANLPEMERGIQKNISEMYALKQLSLPDFIFFKIFSKLKYLLRIARAKR